MMDVERISEQLPLFDLLDTFLSVLSAHTGSLVLRLPVYLYADGLFDVRTLPPLHLDMLDARMVNGRLINRHLDISARSISSPC